MILAWVEEERRVWRAWCDATGIPNTSGPWSPAPYVGFTRVLAWPVLLHPSMYWVQPPLYDRPSPPDTFSAIAAALAERPMPADNALADLVDASHQIRARSGSPLQQAYGPVLPAGTSVRCDRFIPDGCDGFDLLRATVLATPIGDLPVDIPVGRAGAIYLIARLAIVDPSHPLAADQDAAETLHQRLLGLLDPRVSADGIAGSPRQGSWSTRLWKAVRGVSRSRAD